MRVPTIYVKQDKAGYFFILARAMRTPGCSHHFSWARACQQGRDPDPGRGSLGRRGGLVRLCGERVVL